MDQRLKLHDLLCAALGSENVYFQPPSAGGMKYPCIVYSRTQINMKFAGNLLYNHKNGYTVTVIDPNPDSLIPDKVLNLPYCRFDRHYTADNLNHDVFNIYY
jgi:hypothetical protein